MTAVVLTVVLMVLAGLISLPAAAIMHDPIAGSSEVTDRADASMPTNGVQETSDVAVDAFGRVHVVWQDNRGGKYNVMYARSDDGGCSFGPSIQVNDPDGTIDHFNPRVDVDEDGNPYVVWHDPRNSLTTGLDVFLTRSHDGGDTFGPNVRVNSEDNNKPETMADVAVGGGDRVFVVYMSGLGSSSDIYMSFSDDGGLTFGPSTWVDDDTSGARQLGPVVVADRDGIAHVAWTDYRNGNPDIYYATRTVMGIITSNVRVNGDSGGADQDDPAITLHDGTPLVVWTDERNGNADIYMALRSTPTSFGTNRQVNDDATTTAQSEPDVAVERSIIGGQDPVIHIVWEGTRTGNTHIYMADSTDGGVTFDPEELVDDGSGTGVIRHKPAVSVLRGGPLVVTWEDRSDAARGWDVMASGRYETTAWGQTIVADDRPKAYQASPVTIVGPGGRLHAVWIDNRDGPYGVYYSISANGGNAWGTVSPVDGATTDHQHLTPDIAIGSDGTAHVVWTDYRRDTPRVFYANNKDKPSGFNAAVRVDDCPAGSFAVNPSLAIAANGSATVAWLDGRDGGARVRLSYSLNGGVSWKPSVPVPGEDPDSAMSAPDLATRAGLVVVAYTDDAAGVPQPYLCMGDSAETLGTPMAVRGEPSAEPERDVRLALDVAKDGPVHVLWTGYTVLLSKYNPTNGSFDEPSPVIDDTSGGPFIQPCIAAGNGGTVHIAWVDGDRSSPRGMLRTIVPELEPSTLKTLPQGGPVRSPTISFAKDQLSCLMIFDGRASPRVSCAIWENSPPPDPVPQSPANGGWVTRDTFNLTVQTGTDDDGDPVLVRFELTDPEGTVISRGFGVDPRFQISDATEGTYTWMAVVTDGFGAKATTEWSFTVDMTPPGVPELDPLPEYSPGNSITLNWTAVTDPGGGTVSYRVHASQYPSFPVPYLKDSGWVTSTNHTFMDLPATLIHYRLFAKDEAGNVVEATSHESSVQDNEAPKVFISVVPALEVEEGQEVSFDATDSTDDNGIAGYQWDFDSDGNVDSTDGDTTWTYDEAGEYQVTIVISDLAGNTATYSEHRISVLDISAPTIVLDVDPGTEVDEGTQVTFDASGSTDPSGIQVVRWYLDEDEVPHSTGVTTQITFDVPGQHQVTVEAVDNWDNVASQSVTITVTDVTAPIATFTPIGPLDNTKVEFFSIFVNVTDAGGVVTVDLFYKTQDAGVFSQVPMDLVPGSASEWFKDELAPGPKGNATYYVKAIDSAGNELKTDYQRIRVTGVEDPTPPNGNGGDGFDIMDYLWLIILIVIIVVVALVAVAMAGRRKGRPEPETKAATKAGKGKGKKAPPTKGTTKAKATASLQPPVQSAAATTTAATQMVAAERRPAKDKALCAIEEVYFIHNDGRLILAASSTAAADRDAQDVFAGMFTAIQDFIKDSMAREGNLGSFDYGDNRIIIERGHYIACAVTIYGTEPGDLRDEVREVVRQVEGNYAGVIERWDGDKAKLGGITEFAKRILGLTGGVDRETVVRATEKKGVKLLSEVEFFQGFVRLKTAVKNDTETVITDAALDIVYDDNVLRLDHIQPVYEYKRGKVHLGNINAGEKKTVAFNFDPIICMESNIDGNLTFRDVKGSLQVSTMKTRRADIVCPIFFTRENANTAMLKRLVKEELASQDSKVFRYPDGLAPSQAFELCKGVVHLHDVKFVREFFEEAPTWLGEAWFYGETKVKGYKIVIRVTVREDSHTAEFFVASQEMEVITGLLAELGHSLNRMLKEKYMGRLKAQPIVDQRLKKELTDKPLLIEREV